MVEIVTNKNILVYIKLFFFLKYKERLNGDSKGCKKRRTGFLHFMENEPVFLFLLKEKICLEPAVQPGLPELLLLFGSGRVQAQQVGGFHGRLG